MKEKQKETKRRTSLLPAVNEPCFELSGNRELLIEGSKGVLEYAPDSIRVNTSGMILTVSGRGLNLRCISESALMIEGFITALRFAV